MGIDWFTFFVQILNFMILVWLLKRFLYKPVLNAMAKREERIAARLEEARAKVREGEAEKERYRAMREDLRLRIEQEMLEAKKEAERFRDKLMVSVREEVAEKRERSLLALQKEQEAFLAETSAAIAEYFQELSRNVLRELADEQLENLVIAAFLDKLARYEQESVAGLGDHIAKSRAPLVITTAFTLTEEQRDKVRSGLGELIGAVHGFEFVVDRSLLAGLTVEVDGKKIHWDMGEYLKKFEQKMVDFLESHPAMNRKQ